MAFKMKGSPAKLGTIEGTSVYKAVVSGDSPLKQPWPIKVLQKLKKLKAELDLQLNFFIILLIAKVDQYWVIPVRTILPKEMCKCFS